MRYKKNLCANHPSFSPLTLPLPQNTWIYFLYTLVLAQRSFTEDSAFISGVQIHINIAQSGSKEMSVHPYREMCFDPWRLLAVNIVRNLYCWNAKCNFQNFNTTLQKRGSLNKKLRNTEWQFQNSGNNYHWRNQFILCVFKTGNFLLSYSPSTELLQLHLSQIIQHTPEN